MVPHPDNSRVVRLVDPTGSLSVTVDLHRGATVRSLLTRTGVELLAQGFPPADPLRLGADFMASGLTGYVDCLPTIEATDVPGTPGPEPLVDHGAVWAVPWATVEQGRNRNQAWLTAAVDIAGWPLRMQRTVRISARRLRLEYLLENRGTGAVPLLWAGHGLLASPPGSRIRCGGFRELRVTATSATWSPDAAADMFATLSATKGTAAELVLDSVPVGGWVKGYLPWPADGVWLLRPDVTVHEHWEGIPGQGWLGLWVNNLGLPEDPPLRHVALEPTTGDDDNLAQCVARGTAWDVAASSRHRWAVEYTLH